MRAYWRVTLVLVIVAAILTWPRPARAQAGPDLQQQIDELKQQLAGLEALKAKLGELEQQLCDLQAAQRQAQAVVKPVTPSVGRVHVDGRIFGDIVATGTQGPAPQWSTQIGDAKLRLTFLPSDRVTVVTRLSDPDALTGVWDYFYLDVAHVLGPTNTLRLGQRKLDFGQDTWMNGPEEAVVVSPSVSNVTGYGIGLAAVGRFGKALDTPLYEVGFVNGPPGVFQRPTSGLPTNLKLGSAVGPNWYASGSYYFTGPLGGNNGSPLVVAKLSSAPPGASAWERTLWEVDLRCNYGPTGIRPLLPTGKLPPFMLGAAYGRFVDDATGVPDRIGDYWFVEGMLRLNSRFYAGARFSITELAGDDLALLANSPVPVNSYQRTSLALGYALSDLVQLKTEYSRNETRGASPAPSLNSWVVGVAAVF